MVYELCDAYGVGRPELHYAVLPPRYTYLGRTTFPNQWTYPTGLISLGWSKGTPKWEQRHVVLHEMAHHITQQKHTTDMYRMVYELSRGYGQPMTKVMVNEARYMPRPAIAAARKMRIPGAKALADTRKRRWT